MDSDKLASMTASIANGVPKENSRFVVDEESSKKWDTLAAEIAQIRKDHPGADIGIPHEIPG